MRQLVSVVTETSVSYFLDGGDGEPVRQIAQTINPGLDVAEVIDLGGLMTDVLRLNGRKRNLRAERELRNAERDELPAPAPAPEPERRRGPGRPPGPAKRKIRAWGFTQGAVYDVLRKRGPMFISDVVAAFGHDPDDKHAQNAASQTLQALYKDGVATKEVIDAYAPGNPLRWARSRWSAIVVETSSDVEQSSD